MSDVMMGDDGSILYTQGTHRNERVEVSEDSIKCNESITLSIDLPTHLSLCVRVSVFHYSVFCSNISVWYLKYIYQSGIFNTNTAIVVELVYTQTKTHPDTHENTNSDRHKHAH